MSNMTELPRGLMAWECPASAGNPICVTADADGSDVLSVNLYTNDDGDIIGVTIFDRGDDSELQAAVGLLPLETINDERKSFGLPPITLPEWLPVDQIGALT